MVLVVFRSVNAAVATTGDCFVFRSVAAVGAGCIERLPAGRPPSHSAPG